MNVPPKAKLNSVPVLSRHNPMMEIYKWPSTRHELWTSSGIRYYSGIIFYSTGHTIRVYWYAESLITPDHTVVDM
jgi:hypothetical protein